MKKFKSHAQARQLKDKYLTQIVELTNLVIGANEFLAQPEPPSQESYKNRKLKELEVRLQALEYDNKESNTWGVRVNGDLQELHNRILRLERKTADTSDYHNLRLQIQDVEKQLEALEQRSPPSEKGVWVTRKTLIDAYLKTGNINDLAKRLGLEG